MASSETFNAQKGNVVIFSDDGVTAPRGSGYGLCSTNSADWLLRAAPVT